MSEIRFQDEFRTDHGAFRSVFDREGCRLRYEGGSESREIVGKQPEVLVAG
jgi:hypothetical protein